MGKRTDYIKKKKHKRLRFFFIFITILFIGVGGYAYHLYNEIKRTVDVDIYKTVDSIELNPKKAEEGKETLHILLMGVDERINDIGRTDTLILLSLNPNTDRMQLMSIPRDTRTEIVGKGIQDKINHAYPLGIAAGGTEKNGINMTIATVENFLDIELDYYIKMNMEGLPQLVDAVGGITVKNPISWVDSGYYKKGYHYKKGTITLDGEQSIGYVRMRKQDPEGDVGRNKRQRLVIQGIIDKGASLSSINHIDEILHTLGNNMSTNLSFREMKDLFTNYRNTRKHVDSYQISGRNENINGSWYVIVPEEERQKAHEKLITFHDHQS
ncbi:LCP family glycopolymer transferase [Salirhabdus salicampi]|uniref:LCP family glycopolymer transferase n=1 Tax=Salirhabdus salicampi TaxID=476102 RepID=UPI0020C31CC2|nr:LCP family protein [Salirhabdus salicampi]MCP8615833.1 LCP family protein [Salirhabdus salicampi]